MANILVSIATLIIAFVLVGYGVFESTYAANRTSFTTTITSTVDREVMYVSNIRDDLNRVPQTSDVPTGRFATDAVVGQLAFSYGTGSNYGYVCAKAVNLTGAMVEAVQKAATARPAAIVGSDCDKGDGASSSGAAMTVRIY